MKKSYRQEAFPQKIDFDEGSVYCQGMDLRDYFAASIIGGDIARQGTDMSWDCERLAVRVYKMADAMILAREMKK